MGKEHGLLLLEDGGNCIEQMTVHRLLRHVHPIHTVFA